jgi:predicted GNAT family acetyltransferase
MPESLDSIRKKYSDMGVKNFIHENPNAISISQIIVPKDKRDQGIGSSFMRELTQYADSVQKKIVLSPSTDFGGSSVSRLKDFYKRFGFVENKGKSKDFTHSESMHRPPQEGGKVDFMPEGIKTQDFDNLINFEGSFGLLQDMVVGNVPKTLPTFEEWGRQHFITPFEEMSKDQKRKVKDLYEVIEYVFEHKKGQSELRVKKKPLAE